NPFGNNVRTPNPVVRGDGVRLFPVALVRPEPVPMVSVGGGAALEHVSNQPTFIEDYKDVPVLQIHGGGGGLTTRMDSSDLFLVKTSGRKSGSPRRWETDVIRLYRLVETIHSGR
ncbi:hypothetical protein M404DRAFT_1007330, partial [Pisolithus tinctorius Marx 270]